MKKLFLPYTAFAATAIYFLLVVISSLQLARNKAAVFQNHGMLIVTMLIGSVILYELSKNPPDWLRARNDFIKILLQTLAFFAILAFPLGWLDSHSSGWFAGLGTYILLVLGVPLMCIFAGIGYFFHKKTSETAFGTLQIIFCVGMLLFFVSALSNNLKILRAPVLPGEEPVRVMKNSPTTNLYIK